MVKLDSVNQLFKISTKIILTAARLLTKDVPTILKEIFTFRFSTREILVAGFDTKTSSIRRFLVNWLKSAPQGPC